MPAVRSRYAPSPTGHLHLGNARTALLSWLHARQSGGAFVLRIEDLDPGRCRPRYEADMLADLRWLGLDWDEGPDVGGTFGPYRQSQRVDAFAAAIDRLDTFACSCSRREVREASLAPAGAEPLYPGTCRDGPTKPTRAHTLRWRCPDADRIVAFEDLVYGSQQQDVVADAGDFVVRRADGAFAYQLAVVVDDAAMAITHVVRGADLLSSTARQIHLQRALGFPEPTYAHVPIIVGRDGEKLSKRHGAPDLTELRTGGADPAAVVARLCQSAGLVGPAVGRVRPAELVADFDLSRLAASAGDVLPPPPKPPAPGV